MSDATQTMMDSANCLDYIVENIDYLDKLCLALDSKNYSVKKQVFELLSALSVYSNDGYNRTLEALEYFRNHKKERYRFKFIVNELQNGPSLDYQTAIIAFINCLILATADLQERIRIRSEFLGLKLSQILNDLRFKKKECSDLVVQLDVFDEQRESDESQLSPALSNIDLSSPLEIFDAILRQIADSPQEIPFLSILQHLLKIDSREAISDVIWDCAERLVHRATLLESKDDTIRLLKPPTRSSSLQKIKAVGEKCCCQCHRKSSTVTDGLPKVLEEHLPAAPPPPPLPIYNAPPAPPPPMPPPLMNIDGSNPLARRLKQIEESPVNKLPQQDIPCPKAKMRTVNWNKIPSGQIFNSNKENLWRNFANNYKNTSSTLDWEALEGLFCIPTEKMGGSPNMASSNKTLDKPTSQKKETNEIVLVDAKRSLNINIFLKQFRSSNENIIQHILDANSEDIGSERLRGLLKILPSNDEIEMLKAVPESDKARLGSAEKFLLQLIQLKAYRLRIEAMIVKEDLETCVTGLESSIHTILQATSEIRNSKPFQEVVFMILVAGNFLNSGGYAGEACGVKLSSLQKIADIRGNQPGISLLNFISMQAEAKNPQLITFSKDMTSLEDASKTSIDQLKGEIQTLKAKVELICEQLKKPETPKEVLDFFIGSFQDARILLAQLEDQLFDVESARVELSEFFCEDLQTFKLEECFRILHSFVVRWKAAALENQRRKKQEEEAMQRKKIREEQFQKRLQLGWETPQSVENFNNSNKTKTLSPEDDIFIACSPRVVRRRLGSASDKNYENNGGTTPTDQLTLPSPDTTPNGSLRRRRSRVPSDEDETGLMDFLRSSGKDANRERKGGGPEHYGSLDRSWSRKSRRRPNLMDFVNDDNLRERCTSPSQVPSTPSPTKSESKAESPAREWRERIAAWFVDLENGSGEMPKRRPPPRRFQRRLGLETMDLASRGLATLPEGETGQEESALQAITTYQRVYPDRRPSLKLNTDVVSAMEAIEEVQSPTKDRTLVRRLSERTDSDSRFSPPVLDRTNSKDQDEKERGRRSFIESLGGENHNEKLVLYIPEKSLPPVASTRSLKRSPSVPGEKPRVENITSPQSGTSEGFDRFASIRRSRRYKREDLSQVNTPLNRSASLYSTVKPRKFSSKPDEGADEYSSNNKLQDSTRNNDSGHRTSRSSSRKNNDTRTSQDDLKFSRINIPNVITSTNGTSIVQIRGPTQPTREPGRVFHKSILSSSPGTAERDEGFEESHSSLSETNSQSESHNVPNSLKGDRKLSQKLSFKAKSKPDCSVVENDLGYNNAKTSSRASLLSSRSSLTSQTTVGTVRENNDAKRTNNNPIHSSDGKTYPAPITSTGYQTTAFNALDFNKPNPLVQKNLKNQGLINSTSSPTLSNEKSKVNGKGLTPRILSFMRPTASSSAKDKADAAAAKAAKLKLTKKSFR